MTKIAFIGAGNMNGAIISGLIKHGYCTGDIIVSNPSAPKRLALKEKLGILHTSNNLEAAKFADYIVLGVKPHFTEQVCKEIAGKIDVSTKCFISITAGCTISQIQRFLGSPCAIVRAMPNTPSQIGFGVTGIFPSKEVNKSQKLIAEKLMSSVGIIKWLVTEDEIDNITAVSGSGPAYFFLFIEAMVKQAEVLGFSEKESRELVQQTALGAVQMTINNKTTPISELRENVTSKGGTTHAAIQSFIDDGLPRIVTKAMNCALNRAKEMAQSND
jgi:pyrroline-5-carboxylate reductase